MKKKLFFTGLIGLALILFMTGCPDLNTGEREPPPYSIDYELNGGGTLTIAGEGDASVPKTGDSFTLTINGKTLTGTIEVKDDGTIIFKSNSGGEAFTANLEEDSGALTIAGGGGITFDDGSQGAVPQGTVEPELKTVTITGLEDRNGGQIQLGLFENRNQAASGGSPAASGMGAIQNGEAEITLYADGKPWRGTGSWYVGFMITGENSGYITKTPESFSSGSVTVSLSEFEKGEITGGGQDDDDERGKRIGQISGTITLTGIPYPKPHRVYMIGRSSNSDWYSYGSRISLDWVNGSTAANIAWTIPLYENDRTGSMKDQSGTKEVTLYLYIEPTESDSNRGFSINLIGGTKTLNFSDKNNIVAGDLGTANIGRVRLSGTIMINNGGQPVPRVTITADDPDGAPAGFGSILVESPAVTGAAWEMFIPVQNGNAVTFSVNGYDPSTHGWIFRKSGIAPPGTASVSNQPISGINLNIGDISVGGLSGTVTFTNMLDLSSFGIAVDAYYIVVNAYFPNGEGSDGEWMSGNVALNGSAGTWAIPRNDVFLAALESGDQKVSFTFHIYFDQGEVSIGSNEVQRTIGKNALTGIDLGSVGFPY